MKKVKYMCMVAFWVLVLWVASYFARTDLQAFPPIYNDFSVKAEVLDIVDRYEATLSDKALPFHQGIIVEFTAKILSGNNKGKKIFAMQNVDKNSPFGQRVCEKGDRVLLNFFSDDSAGSYWTMTDFIRTDFLIILFLIFSIALLCFGRTKGVNTLISLGLTCVSVFNVLIPAILSGKNIYFWSIFVCAYMTLMTLTIVNGLNKKCLCSTLGCIAGSMTAGLITIVSDVFLKLTGVINEEAVYLKYILGDREIDLKAIIFASILIGAVGAIMDVSTSISSSLYEIYQKIPNCTVSDLMASGLTIGRDIMGTMANTLMLAYIGGSLSLTVLLIAYSSSVLSLFNREMIVVEVLQALAGSFAILLTIPLTSLIAGVLYTGKIKFKMEGLKIPPKEKII